VRKVPDPDFIRTRKRREAPQTSLAYGGINRRKILGMISPRNLLIKVPTGKRDEVKIPKRLMALRVRERRGELALGEGKRRVK